MIQSHVPRPVKQVHRIVRRPYENATDEKGPAARLRCTHPNTQLSNQKAAHEFHLPNYILVGWLTGERQRIRILAQLVRCADQAQILSRAYVSIRATDTRRGLAVMGYG